MNGIIRWIHKKWNNTSKFRETNISQRLNNTAFNSFHSNSTAFDIEFADTEHGKQKLIKDSYLYIFQKKLGK